MVYSDVRLHCSKNECNLSVTLQNIIRHYPKCFTYINLIITRNQLTGSDLILILLRKNWVTEISKKIVQGHTTGMSVSTN